MFFDTSAIVLISTKPCEQTAPCTLTCIVIQILLESWSCPRSKSRTFKTLYSIQRRKQTSRKTMYTQLKTHTVTRISSPSDQHQNLSDLMFRQHPFHSTCPISLARASHTSAKDIFGLVATERSSSSSTSSSVRVSGGNGGGVKTSRNGVQVP